MQLNAQNMQKWSLYNVCVFKTTMAGVPGGAANQLYSVINDDKHEERVNVNVTGREDRGLRDMASL